MPYNRRKGRNLSRFHHLRDRFDPQPPDKTDSLRGVHHFQKESEEKFTWNKWYGTLPE